MVRFSRSGRSKSAVVSLIITIVCLFRALSFPRCFLLIIIITIKGSRHLATSTGPMQQGVPSMDTTKTGV